VTGHDAAGVPWWGVASAVAAPVLLIGGWTLAAALQENGFDQVAGTISALAALDADHRWVMTAGIAGTGVAHVVTALALRHATTAGRVWHALGGAATTAVAFFPLPAGESEGGAPLHALTAAAAFGLLGTWPLVERVARGRRTPRGLPAGLRTPAAAGASVLLLGTLAWFATELGGDRVGLAERVAAACQAGWPLVVVLTARAASRQSATD
jgi:hypothetical membrane protein